MAGKRIYSPSILIDLVEYKCLAKSVELTPGDYITFCEQEWMFKAEIELGYGVTESWNLLSALDNEIVDVVLKPEDAAGAVTNPKATFQIRMPGTPFMMAVDRGDRMVFPLEVRTEAPPVITLVP